MLSKHEKDAKNFELSYLSSWASNCCCQHLSLADKIWVVNSLGSHCKLYRGDPRLLLIMILFSECFLALSPSFSLPSVFAFFLATINHPLPRFPNYSLAFRLLVTLHCSQNDLPKWKLLVASSKPWLALHWSRNKDQVPFLAGLTTKVLQIFSHSHHFSFTSYQRLL